LNPASKNTGKNPPEVLNAQCQKSNCKNLFITIKQKVLTQEQEHNSRATRELIKENII